MDGGIDLEVPGLDSSCSAVSTVAHLGRLLRDLRRWDARRRSDAEWTSRELAAKTGWSVGVISDYFAGTVLPPTDRFDTLVRLLGATGTQIGALATARDRVEEHRRTQARIRTEPAGGEAGPVRPRQLPPATRHFVGRVDELAALTDQLDSTHTDTVPILVIDGMPGVGKTTLAVHWAHRCTTRFPDGQLWVNLRGHDPSGPPMNPAEALRGFLEALGVPSERIPASPAAQAGLYRSLLVDRRMLVLLDNARDADQVRPLVPGGPGCVVVVTSRDRLTSLVTAEGAYPVALEPMSATDARDLLARRLGPDRVAAEPGAADAVIAACERLPLALAILAARAADRPDLALATFAAELRHAADRLDVLGGGDAAADLRVVFSWSYRSLGPDAARLFRLMGWHPGPHSGLSAVASLTGLVPEQARRLLAELVRAHLVVERRPGRYAQHDLIRAYAIERSEADDSPDERAAALRRCLDYYLHTAYAAARALHPTRDPIALSPPSPGIGPDPIGERAAALSWLHGELPNLVAAVDRAAGAGFDTHTWQLAWTLTNVLDFWGRWPEWTQTQRAAVQATRRLGDRPGEARALRLLARAYMRRGWHDEARTLLLEALDRCRELGDQIGQGHAQFALARTHEYQGRPAEALDRACQALALFRAAGYLVGQADALNMVGWYQVQTGDYRGALDHCREALGMHLESGDVFAQSAAWDSLGYAHHHLCEWDAAVDCYRRALALNRELDDRNGEATIFVHLGETHHEAGRTEAARDAWSSALEILDEQNHPDASGVRARLEELS